MILGAILDTTSSTVDISIKLTINLSEEFDTAGAVRMRPIVEDSGVFLCDCTMASYGVVWGVDKAKRYSCVKACAESRPGSSLVTYLHPICPCRSSINVTEDSDRDPVKGGVEMNSLRLHTNIIALYRIA